MAAAICKHVGARHVVITDVNEYRLDLAKKWVSPVQSMLQKKSNRCDEKIRYDRKALMLD